jgi:predicted SprT family Zn-dependent metalloprotease
MLKYAGRLARRVIPSDFSLTIKVNHRLSKVLGRFLSYGLDLNFGEVEISAKTVKAGCSCWTETVRHELAHALEYARHGCTGHGRNWRIACQSTGCTGEVTGDLPDEVFRYQFICSECGHKMMTFDRLTPKRLRLACYGKCVKCSAHVHLIDRKLHKEAA